MNNLLVEDLKQDFLEEVSSFLGACSCGNKKCKSVVFEAIGVSSNFQYVIEYDSDPQGFSNMLIYVKKGELFFHIPIKQAYQVDMTYDKGNS